MIGIYVGVGEETQRDKVTFSNSHWQENLIRTYLAKNKNYYALH